MFLERPQLGRPPDERHPRLGFLSVHRLTEQDRGANGSLPPFQGQRRNVLQIERPTDTLARHFAEQDAARGSGRLEARGDVHGVPDDGVLDHAADLARAGDDLARLNADPQAQGQPVRLLQLLVETGQGALHRQGAPQCAGRVVLVGHGRAEQDHDGVADQLVNGPLEADGLSGELPETIGGDVADLFWVEPL